MTKDLVYLGLIALAGVIFYFHGYFAGLGKGRRKEERLEKHLEPVRDGLLEDEGLVMPIKDCHRKARVRYGGAYGKFGRN